MKPDDLNVMRGGTGWPPDDLTPRQHEVLVHIAEHDSESWGDVWAHCTDWPGGPLAFANFNRVAEALVRKGAVIEGDRLEVTPWGRQILNARTK